MADKLPETLSVFKTQLISWRSLGFALLGLFVVLLTGCRDGVWNSPYPADEKRSTAAGTCLVLEEVTYLLALALTVAAMLKR